MTTDCRDACSAGRSQELAEQRSADPPGQESELGHRAAEHRPSGTGAKGLGTSQAGPPKCAGEAKQVRQERPSTELVLKAGILSSPLSNPEVNFALCGGSLGRRASNSIAGSRPG